MLSLSSSKLFSKKSATSSYQLGSSFHWLFMKPSTLVDALNYVRIQSIIKVGTHAKDFFGFLCTFTTGRYLNSNYHKYTIDYFCLRRRALNQFLFLLFQILVSIPQLSSPSHSSSLDLDVFCSRGTKHPKTKTVYPATMIKNSTGNIVPFIFWTQEVGGVKPLERCTLISQHIQKMLDDKTWSEAYLRTGYYNGYPAICMVSAFSDKECTLGEVIIQLSRSQNSRKVLEAILGNRMGLELTGSISFTFGENHPAYYIDIHRLLRYLQIVES
jgi:hypothetical protein